LAEMKNVADYAYAFGAQEFVVCASAYQPWIDKIPGSTGGGRQYCLNRNNTYWNYSRPFWDYQARCAGLMRNGLSVADLCVYLGENAPIKLLAYRLPVIPEGYDFDVCTKDALISRMSAKDGRIVLPDGVSYQMLVLQRNGDVSLEALRQIAKLVKEGVSVYGPSPAGSETLKDTSFAKEYQELVNQLWGKEQSGTNVFGKGKVYWGMTLAEALSKQGIQPDAGFKSGNTPTDKLYFAHRRLADTDIYFLNNHSQRAYNDTIRLRTNSTNAEYWDPTTGQQYALHVTANGKDGLLLNVVLQPNESGFIVTSNQTSSSLPLKLKGIDEKVTSIEGEWKVFFDPKWGGPGEVTFANLNDWTENEDKRIKFYSGTAVYRKTIQIDKPFSGKQVLLRFPQLGSIARVFLNGKEISTVWCSPWEADVTTFIQKGENALEIQVVNSLNNRMVGDASLPQSERFTYAYPEITTPKDKLVPSGIMDKVLLIERSK
jgi:Glycosyl hydrolases family 2, sugar binding domain.